MKPIHSDEAVSPILATILILLLTVVLFAAVAAIVLNMGDTAPVIRLVTFTAQQQGEYIYVTYHGGPNQLDVADPGITAMVNDIEMARPFPKSGHIEVGTSAQTLGTLGRDHVVVITTFKDGRKQISLDTWV